MLWLALIFNHRPGLIPRYIHDPYLSDTGTATMSNRTWETYSQEQSARATNPGGSSVHKSVSLSHLIDRHAARLSLGNNSLQQTTTKETGTINLVIKFCIAVPLLV